MMTKQPDIDTLIGTAVYSFCKALIATGITPARAASLTAFAVIEGTIGRAATKDLGIPRATLSKWRREVAAAAESAEDIDEAAITVEAMNALLPMLGMRDLRMVQGGADDER